MEAPPLSRRLFQQRLSSFSWSGAIIVISFTGAGLKAAKEINHLLGKKTTRPDDGTVRRVIGFGIGDVPSVGTKKGCGPSSIRISYISPLIYAAAGTPKAIFAVSRRDLVRITEAEVFQIKKGVGIY